MYVSSCASYCKTEHATVGLLGFFRWMLMKDRVAHSRVLPEAKKMGRTDNAIRQIFNAKTVYILRVPCNPTGESSIYGEEKG